MSKEKAIEIVKNLSQTIDNMTENTMIESECSIFKPFRATKDGLRAKRKTLIKKYKLK